ncbi:hypothetical protein NDU88_006794 [Pleurodeles waltl]|uniref:Secreted protein n=1 Tax=Pleurodeles waltl TaxID=8319 RepID=A0AAV7N091_PLEWA|nr:hypothetical protein NDU88_006794 [Pleurodeles waltl]
MFCCCPVLLLRSVVTAALVGAWCPARVETPVGQCASSNRLQRWAPRGRDPRHPVALRGASRPTWPRAACAVPRSCQIHLCTLWSPGDMYCPGGCQCLRVFTTLFCPEGDKNEEEERGGQGKGGAQARPRYFFLWRRQQHTSRAPSYRPMLQSRAVPKSAVEQGPRAPVLA